LGWCRAHAWRSTNSLGFLAPSGRSLFGGDQSFHFKVIGALRLTEVELAAGFEFSGRFSLRDHLFPVELLGNRIQMLINAKIEPVGGID
jgi:hypothetical protein